MDNRSQQIARITKGLSRLNAMQLGEVEQLASKLDAQRVRQQSKKESGDESPHSRLFDRHEIMMIEERVNQVLAGVQPRVG